MEKSINYLNLHRVIKKLRWNEAETKLGDISMLWNGTTVTVNKLFEDVYSVTHIFSHRQANYEVKRTFLVDINRGISPVEEFESDFDREYARHIIFQDAPYRPFKRNKAKWFITELNRFLKYEKVTEGKEHLAELLEKVKRVTI